MSLIAVYQHQAVRDLAWSCFGPSLIEDFSPFSPDAKHCSISLTPARKQWLEQLDQNPEPLEEHLAAVSNPRLGICFEALWQFFLQQDPSVDLIASNLPVRDQNRTLGEFDLLLFCHQQQQAIHLELAIKFYLLNPQQVQSTTGFDPFKVWLGPNCRDRFDLKLQRLIEHQSRLSATEAAGVELARLGIESPRTEIALKGGLFYHEGGQAHGALSDTHWRGQWLPLHQLDQSLDDNGHYLILDKQQWLSPAVVFNDEKLLDRTGLLEQLRSYFEHSERPLMISTMIENSDCFIETERWFVTGNDWPGMISGHAAR